MSANPNTGDINVWVAPQAYATRYYRFRVIGHILSFSIYGASFSASSRYFLSQAATEDSLFKRSYLALVMTLNTAATVVVAVDTVSQFVAQERTIDFIFSTTIWDLLWNWLFCAVIALSQLFLIRRAIVIMINSNGPAAMRDIMRKPSVILVSTFLSVAWIASVIGLAAGLSEVKEVHKPKDAFTISEFERYALPLGLIASASADVTISTTLGLHWVQRLRQNRGFNRKTDSMLSKLIAFTISTALYTTVPATIAGIVACSTVGSGGVVSGYLMLMFSDPLPQLYSTALFTTLNIRQTLRQDRAFRPTKVTTPTLRHIKSNGEPVAPSRSAQCSLGSDSGQGFGSIEAHLESGGFQVRAYKYTNTGLDGSAT